MWVVLVENPETEGWDLTGAHRVRQSARDQAELWRQKGRKTKCEPVDSLTITPESWISWAIKHDI